MHAFPTSGRSSARSKAGATFRVPSGNFSNSSTSFRHLHDRSGRKPLLALAYQADSPAALFTLRQGYSRLPDDLRRCLCASLDAYVPPRVFSCTPFPV